jgi:hypothetical protein
MGKNIEVESYFLKVTNKSVMKNNNDKIIILGVMLICTSISTFSQKKHFNISGIIGSEYNAFYI